MNKGAVSIVSTLVGGMIGAVAGVGVVGKISGKTVDETKRTADKYLALFQMMNQWVRAKQEGKNLSSYFVKNNYKKIAIYGMSLAGESLLEELRDSDIQVLYGIDQRADNMYSEVDIVTMEDPLEKVDAIIVTAITYFNEIEEKLSEKVECPIISLEDILYEV